MAPFPVLTSLAVSFRSGEAEGKILTLRGGVAKATLAVLRFRQGLEYAELASAFGIKVGAARMRVSRALTRMRDFLTSRDRQEVVRMASMAAPAAVDSDELFDAAFEESGEAPGAPPPKRRRSLFKRRRRADTEEQDVRGDTPYVGRSLATLGAGEIEQPHALTTYLQAAIALPDALTERLRDLIG